MTTTATMRSRNDPTGGSWDWTPQPEARALVERLLVTFIEQCPDAARFGERLLQETGTLITDWVGVILTPDTAETRAALEEAGYVPRPTEFIDADIEFAFWNPAASTPDILLTGSPRMSVGLQIDSVADFFAANQLSGVDHIQGEPHARARWAQAVSGNGAALWVFERHGYDGFHLKFEIAEHRIAAAHHFERLRARTRSGDQQKVFEEVERAVQAAADELGADWAADLFMYAEREFFLRNHSPAKHQCLRQQTLGMGMANTDHTVYACSGKALHATTELFAALGFEKRESFAVGDADTAIVLEQPVTGHVVALVTPSGDKPGVSGSWARLLGEGILASGPAGLALRGEFDMLAIRMGIENGEDCVRSSAVVDDAWLAKLSGEGLIDAGFADAVKSGGTLGPALTLVSRSDGARGLSADTIAWRGPGKA